MIRKLILAALFGVVVAPRAIAADLPSAATSAGGVRIVVPAHDIARGQVISESDLTYSNVVGGALMNGTVTNFDTVKNMEARRVLRAGETLRADDVRRPIVVAKGQTVTMTFEAPGVALTAMGRAMSEGGIGDSVTVQNPASFRMVTAVVTAAGTVRAAGPLYAAPTVASNNRLLAR
jgi:flagellar basal body P-ring formation protein FlgA